MQTPSSLRAKISLITKSRVDPCRYDRVIDVTRKNADRQTAFQLYIIDGFINCITIVGKSSQEVSQITGQ